VSESVISTVGVVGVLFLSFIPVNMKIGADISKVLKLYAVGLLFRALFVFWACFNGARIEVLIGIMVSVVLEVVVLARIGMVGSRKEILV